MEFDDLIDRIVVANKVKEAYGGIVVHGADVEDYTLLCKRLN